MNMDTLFGKIMWWMRKTELDQFIFSSLNQALICLIEGLKNIDREI